MDVWRETTRERTGGVAMAAKSAVIYFHVQNGSGTEANAADKGNESLYSFSNAECFIIIIIITVQFDDRSP